MLELFGALALLASPSNDIVVEKENEKDPVVCTRRGNWTVGTRMKQKRTCLRKSEWDFIEQQTQREVQQLRDNHLSPGRAEGGRSGPE